MIRLKSFMDLIIKHNIDSSLPFSSLIYLICDSLGHVGEKRHFEKHGTALIPF